MSPSVDRNLVTAYPTPSLDDLTSIIITPRVFFELLKSDSVTQFRLINNDSDLAKKVAVKE